MPTSTANEATTVPAIVRSAKQDWERITKLQTTIVQSGA
jgi:hypothetical protein